MATWIVENSVVAGGLALAVALASRFNQRRPAVCHLLWLLVLVVLVAPPLPRVAASGPDVRGALRGWLAAVVPARDATASWTNEPFEVLGDDMYGVPAATGAVADDELRGGSFFGPALRAADEPSPLFFGLLGLWATGALWMLVREARRVARFARHVRGARVAGPELLRSVRAVARELDVSVPPVRLIDGVGTPSVWCLGRPLLLWPRDRAERPESALIAHELAHLARRDHWVARFELLCRVLFFWHPLFWFVRGRIHDYAELSCDAWALWAYPAERRAFAGALIDVQQDVARAPIPLQGLCATNSEFRNFERRLCMIMKTRVTRKVPKSVAALALVATALVLPGYGGEGAGDALEYAPRKTAATLVETKELAWKAEREFQAGSYEQALALYEQVLALDPDHGKALGRAGYMLVGSGRYDAARAAFERQLGVGYQPSTAAYNLACTAALAGDTKTAQKRLKQAVSLGFTNADLMAKDPDLEAIRGTEVHSTCVAAVQRAVVLRKKLAEVGKRDAKVAHEVRTALVEIVPGDGELLDEHGLALLSQGELSAAAKAFELQAEAGHDVPRAHYNLACALARSGDREAALKSLKRSLKLGMTNESVFQDGDLKSLHGDEDFEWIAKELAAPAAAKAAIELALTSGEHEQAAGLLERALADGRLSRKGRGWVLYELGETQQELGHHEAALASYERALASDYKVGQVTFGIARALASAGEQDAATAHLGHAVALGFDDAEAVWKAGEAWGLAEDRLVELVERAEHSAKEWGYEKKKPAYGGEEKAPEDATEVSKKRPVH